MDINSSTIIGRLTKDPNKVSEKLCVFTVAVNDRGDDNTIFIDCKAAGKTGDLVAQYLKKGSQVALTGKLTQDKWEKDGKKFSKIGLFVANCQFLGKPANQGNQESVPVNLNETFVDSEMPF